MNFSRLINRKRRARYPSLGAVIASGDSGDGVPSRTHSVLGEESRNGPTNRIVAGRKEFVDVYMHLAKGKRNWQIAAFTALGLLSIQTLAYIQLASSSHITPYVVEVDALGQARAFGPAEQLRDVDHRLAIHQLSLFIRNIRTIYQDPYAQKDMILAAYAYVDPNAQEWLNAYFSDPANDPRLLGQTISRRVEIKSVIKIPQSESWKINWIEVETPRGTDTQKRSAWEGFLTVKHVPPSSAATIERNPTGLYITAINWTQVSRGT